MATVIMNTHNGDHTSKEAFIKQLLDMLANHPLDRRMESCGGLEYFANNNVQLINGIDDFYYDKSNENFERIYCTRTLPENVWHFGGNFFDYSFGYSIFTDEPEIIKELLIATQYNTQRDDYLAQEQPERYKCKTDIIRHEPNFPDCLACPANIIYH